MRSKLALTIGAILIAAGAIGLFLGWSTLPLIIVGAIVFVSAYAEPIYGRLARRAPDGIEWRPTDERFIDPDTGKLVTVWFDPANGQRRYVADKEQSNGS